MRPSSSMPLGRAGLPGLSSCGWVKSRRSHTGFAFASRSVSAGRFHFASIVARTDVWS
jgi:hypothetical protein